MLFLASAWFFSVHRPRSPRATAGQANRGLANDMDTYAGRSGCARPGRSILKDANPRRALPRGGGEVGAVTSPGTGTNAKLSKVVPDQARYSRR